MEDLGVVRTVTHISKLHADSETGAERELPGKKVPDWDVTGHDQIRHPDQTGPSGKERSGSSPFVRSASVDLDAVRFRRKFARLESWTHRAGKRKAPSPLEKRQAAEFRKVA